MKTPRFLALVIMITCLATVVSSAADSTQAGDPMQTLIPSDNYTSGGFGGPVIKVGPIDGSTGVLFGGRGGWVINRTFVIGGGGYGFANMHGFNTSTSNDTSVSFGYGGLELEYLISSSSIVHGTILTHIGAGGFTVFRGQGGMGNDWDGYSLYNAACFVFEPQANVEVNILSWLRLTVGAGYRFVTGIDATIGNRRYDNSTVSGFFGVGMLKFGPY